MHLSPRDIDKLLLHNAGFLAQKRLARGLRLNYPETIALLASQILELIRDGDRSVAELMDVGRRILGHRQVMEGVARLVHDVQVEGTFPDGTKLVTVHDPICLNDGDLSLALYGSFLPIPDVSVFAKHEEPQLPTQAAQPSIDAGHHAGEIDILEGDIELYPGRARVLIEVTSTGDRPIQIGSHYPFSQANRALEFDRTIAAGKHLDIPAGNAVRFEPGETRTVCLVENGNSEVLVRGLSPRAIAQQFDRASGKLPLPPGLDK